MRQLQEFFSHFQEQCTRRLHLFGVEPLLHFGKTDSATGNKIPHQQCNAAGIRGKAQLWWPSCAKSRPKRIQGQGRQPDWGDCDSLSCFFARASGCRQQCLEIAARAAEPEGAARERGGWDCCHCAGETIRFIGFVDPGAILSGQLFLCQTEVRRA